MRKFLLLILIASCAAKDNTPKKQIEKDLLEYLKTSMKKLNFAATVDSVKFVRLDTITEKLKVLMKARELEAKFNDLQEDYHKLKDEAESNLQLMKLSQGLSKTLYENYRTEGLKTTDKMKDIAEKMSIVGRTVDSLDSVALIVDSSKCIAYNVVYIYQFTRSDRTVNRDTGYHILYPDYRLWKKEDFLKLEVVE